ncbi:MAG: hypothetical protein NTV77_02605 [Candidatus Azambacteria bacterium]|nr:hypothetical protein [Candidatus Azambacteria bacterium]
MKDAFEKAGEDKIQKVVNNKDIKQAASLILRVPPIKKVGATAEKQEIIDKAVADVRQYLADIPGHMDELVSRIRKIQEASPEERVVRFSELKALEAEVAAHLNVDNEVLRSAAKKAHEIANMRALANISVAEISANKQGKTFLVISDLDNGRKFLPGGVLLAESDGKAVRTVKAVGGFQKIMEEIIESRVFIPVWALNSRYFDKPANMAEEKFRLARILHAILRQGIAEAQKTK